MRVHLFVLKNYRAKNIFFRNIAYFLTFSKCSKLTLYISIKPMLWWMCCRGSLFWDDYAKTMEKAHPGISKTKGFPVSASVPDCVL